MPFIEQIPSPSPPPPAIYNTSEHNKENILPFDFIKQFHLPNIIPEFDTHFKTFAQYRNYHHQCLSPWMNNANFKIFDSAYCHHRLILWQKEGLQTLLKQINIQIEELETQDECQKHNINIVLPNLQAKGLAVHITDTLGQLDTVGAIPFSYPISMWDPRSHPSSSTSHPYTTPYPLHPWSKEETTVWGKMPQMQKRIPLCPHSLGTRIWIWIYL